MEETTKKEPIKENKTAYLFFGTSRFKVEFESEKDMMFFRSLIKEGFKVDGMVC
jgi:hypothetical protein